MIVIVKVLSTLLTHHDSNLSRAAILRNPENNKSPPPTTSATRLIKTHSTHTA